MQASSTPRFNLEKPPSFTGDTALQLAALSGVTGMALAYFIGKADLEPEDVKRLYSKIRIRSIQNGNPKWEASIGLMETGTTIALEASRGFSGAVIDKLEESGTLDGAIENVASEMASNLLKAFSTIGATEKRTGNRATPDEVEKALNLFDGTDVLIEAEESDVGEPEPAAGDLDIELSGVVLSAEAKQTEF
jgi:hypothetical protein